MTMPPRAKVANGARERCTRPISSRSKSGRRGETLPVEAALSQPSWKQLAKRGTGVELGRRAVSGLVGAMPSSPGVKMLAGGHPGGKTAAENPDAASPQGPATSPNVSSLGCQWPSGPVDPVSGHCPFLSVRRAFGCTGWGQASGATPVPQHGPTPPSSVCYCVVTT